MYILLIYITLLTLMKILFTMFFKFKSCHEQIQNKGFMSVTKKY